jgi:hypothetical protein
VADVFEVRRVGQVFRFDEEPEGLGGFDRAVAQLAFDRGGHGILTAQCDREGDCPR